MICREIIQNKDAKPVVVLIADDDTVFKIEVDGTLSETDQVEAAQKAADQIIADRTTPKPIAGYSDLRRAAYLKEWPLSKQFEALTESAMGRPEKLKELLTFIDGIKQQYPKS